MFSVVVGFVRTVVLFLFLVLLLLLLLFLFSMLLDVRFKTSEKPLDCLGKRGKDQTALTWPILFLLDLGLSRPHNEPPAGRVDIGPVPVVILFAVDFASAYHNTTNYLE